MNKNFWKNKTVCVTGYEGFLGSHLTRHLVAAGAKVVGVDIRAGSADNILTPAERRRIRAHRLNVVNARRVREIFRRCRPAVVFHLAAEALVQECRRNPAKAFSSNIQGTWSVLEACRLTPGIEAAVIASSDKAYGTHRQLPYREQTPLQGEHPYDVSKSCADLLALSYFHTFGLPVAVTRCGNIFGPGDLNFSRLIPDAMRSVVRGRTLLIRSDGTFTRDYVYVDDIVDGYLRIAERLKNRNLSGQAFNLSYGRPLSVLEIVGKIYRVAGVPRDVRILREARHEIRHQYLSSVKARKAFGWRPKRNMETALRTTLDWYRQRLDGKGRQR